MVYLLFTSYMTKKKRAIYIFISTFLGILYFYISFLVDKDIFRGIDYGSMKKVQAVVSRGFDLPFSICTFFGSSETTLLAIGIIFFVLFWKKKHIFLGLFLYFTIFIIELMGKFFIFHPSPPKILNRYVFDFHLPSSFIVHTESSYPSGHMARSAYVAVILLFLLFLSKIKRFKKGILFFLLFLFIGIMFYSRIYLGEHWFSDCLGGLLLGSSIATLTMGFW